MAEKITKSDAEWRQELTPEQYEVTRKKGTERPFTGALYHNKASGVYRCVSCGAELFSSETKYDSGSGWPSFWLPASEENIETETDTSYHMIRTEVKCSRCEAHSGICSKMGLSPPACATASTPRPWILIQQERNSMPKVELDAPRPDFSLEDFRGKVSHASRLQGAEACGPGIQSGVL